MQLTPQPRPSRNTARAKSTTTLRPIRKKNTTSWRTAVKAYEENYTLAYDFSCMAGANMMLMTDAQLLQLAMEILPPPELQGPETLDYSKIEADWAKVKFGMLSALGMRVDALGNAALMAERERELKEGLVSFRLHVTVLGARNLAKSDAGSDSDPYIRLKYTGQDLVCHTRQGSHTRQFILVLSYDFLVCL